MNLYHAQLTDMWAHKQTHNCKALNSEYLLVVSMGNARQMFLLKAYRIIHNT